MALCVWCPVVVGAQIDSSPPVQPAGLTQAQADSIGNGLLVVQRWPIPGAPWPRARLYQFVSASPEQSAAMLADYEHQPCYLKTLRLARIQVRRDPTSTEVRFRYDVPMAPDAEYVVLDSLSHPSDGEYAISWHLVSSSSLSRAEGSARFIAWRNPATQVDGTLLIYEQLVVPRSWLSHLVPDSRALRDAVAAMRAIAGEIERERKSDAELLDRQVAALELALRK